MEAHIMDTLSLKVPDTTYTDDAPATPHPLSFWKMALAVFVGNILTAAFGTLAYFAVTK
jgi:hypothetical protein